MELDQLWMPKCLRLGWCISFSPSPFEQGVWKRHYIQTVQELRLKFLQVRGSHPGSVQLRIKCNAEQSGNKFMTVASLSAACGSTSQKQQTRRSRSKARRGPPEGGEGSMQEPATEGRPQEEAVGCPATVEGCRQTSKRHCALQLPGQPGRDRTDPQRVRLQGISTAQFC